jgi:hypothetical protein
MASTFWVACSISNTKIHPEICITQSETDKTASLLSNTFTYFIFHTAKFCPLILRDFNFISSYTNHTYVKAQEQVKFNQLQCTSHKTNRIISEHIVISITMPIIFCSWNVFLLCSVKFPCERQIKVAPLNWYSNLICQWGLCSPSFSLERITHVKPGGQVTWIRYLIVLRDFHARQRSIYYPRKQLSGLMTFGVFLFLFEQIFETFI